MCKVFRMKITHTGWWSRFDRFLSLGVLSWSSIIDSSNSELIRHAFSETFDSVLSTWYFSNIGPEMRSLTQWIQSFYTKKWTMIYM